MTQARNLLLATAFSCMIAGCANNPQEHDLSELSAEIARLEAQIEGLQSSLDSCMATPQGVESKFRRPSSSVPEQSACTSEEVEKELDQVLAVMSADACLDTSAEADEDALAKAKRIKSMVGSNFCDK